MEMIHTVLLPAILGFVQCKPDGPCRKRWVETASPDTPAFTRKFFGGSGATITQAPRLYSSLPRSSHFAFDGELDGGVLLQKARISRQGSLKRQA